MAEYGIPFIAGMIFGAFTGMLLLVVIVGLLVHFREREENDIDIDFDD